MDHRHDSTNFAVDGMDVDWVSRRWPDEPLRWLMDRWIQVLPWIWNIALLVLNYLAPQWGSGKPAKTDHLAELP